MVNLELQAKDLIQIKYIENNIASALETLMHHITQLIPMHQNIIQQIHIDRLKHD